VDEFQRDGVLVIKAKEFFTPEEVKVIIESACDLENWPETPGKWMKYFEKSKVDGSRILNRVENWLQYIPELEKLFGNQGKVTEVVSDLFCEKSVLYKEKVNYKLPGGDGFKPHQDHAAGWWRYNQTIHITALIGVDHATAENGALEVVRGEHKKGLFGAEYAEVPEEFVNKWQWELVELEAGDLVFFDSYVPHRSAPNASTKPRRAMYVTWNKESEGDYREKYYADKRISYPPDCERKEGINYEYKI
jgi:ectoine hydroxylase-related dioxygenase (phytanoyl-CoA dioxygenase family)